MDQEETDLYEYLNHPSKGVREYIQKALDELEIYKRLDHDFAQTLSDIANNEHAEIYDTRDYESVAKNISNSQTVIYFKSAGKFRVYDAEEVESLLPCHIRTYCCRKDQKQQKAYEIIDDNKPQKIVMIFDSRDKSEVETIKRHIIRHAESIGKPIESKDVLIFDNEHTQTYEIILNSIVVTNREMKDEFINKICRYIEREEKSVKSINKMKLTDSDIPGTIMSLVPSMKKLVSGQVGELIRSYITPYGSSPGIVLNVTNNVTINNSINNSNINSHNVIQTSDNENDSFVEHLALSPPDWYYPGNIIDYELLYSEYCDIVGYISKKSFTTKYHNDMFVKLKRVMAGKKYTQYIEIL